jgi:hypothetical protein
VSHLERRKETKQGGLITYIFSKASPNNPTASSHAFNADAFPPFAINVLHVSSIADLSIVASFPLPLSVEVGAVS